MLEDELKIYDNTLTDINHHNPEGYDAIRLMEDDMIKNHFRGQYALFERAYNRFLVEQYGLDFENFGD